MWVNGERSTISVRGIVRPQDITGENLVLSTAIGNAEINYNGRGFISRSTNPSLFNRISNLFGLGF